MNNAGQIQGGTLTELTEDELDLVMDVNLRAPMLLTRAVLPLMKQQRSGHIVAVSSVAAFFSHETVTPYATTKAGLTREYGMFQLEFAWIELAKSVHWLVRIVCEIVIGFRLHELCLPSSTF